MKNSILQYIKILSNSEEIQKLLIETIGKILSKQNNIEKYVKENEDKIIHIRDWISSIIQNNEEWKNPRVLTLDALNNTADKYFNKKNNKIQTIELDETHEKLIADLGDYYVIQMLTPEALDNESKVMQHCIGHGGYDKRLDNEDYQYLSLRDKFNKAHVTIEVKNNEIIQLQGKQNKTPELKYLIPVIIWLKQHNYIIKLENFNLVYNKNDKNIYSKYELPNNCEMDGNLDLNNIDIKILPNNLTINGNLNLYRSSIIKLPNNLTINGNLNLSQTRIQTLPDDIKINKNLYLIESNIKNLPNNLSIGKDIYLYSCKTIEELPNNLTCEKILIDKKQSYLIGETMNIKKIIIFDGLLSYSCSKHGFFTKFKQKNKTYLRTNGKFFQNNQWKKLSEIKIKENVDYTIADKIESYHIIINTTDNFLLYIKHNNFLNGKNYIVIDNYNNILDIKSNKIIDEDKKNNIINKYLFNQKEYYRYY